MKLRLLPALVPLLTLFLPAPILRAQYVQATTNYVQHFFRLSTQAVPGTVASILGTATVHRATSAVRADDSDRADLATVATWADRSVYSTFSDYSTNATYFAGTEAWMEFTGHTAVVHRIVAENTNFVLVSRLLGYNGPYTPLHYSGTNQSGLPHWQTLGLVVPNGTLTHDPSALTWTMTTETNIYYGIGERVFTNKSESAYSLPVVLHAQSGGEAQGGASLSWGLTTESPDPVVTVSTLDFTTAFTNTSALVTAEAVLRASGDIAVSNYADAVSAAAKTQAVDEASAYVDSVVPTSSVAYATSAGTANLATNATILLGESAWITMSGTTGLLYRVERTDTNVIRVVSHSQDYNGPSGPFEGPTIEGEELSWGDTVLWNSLDGYFFGRGSWISYVGSATLPATYPGAGEELESFGSVTLDWGLQTNAYAIATTADLDAALAAYSTNGHLHAIADVTGLQSELDTIPDEAEIESIAEAAASAAQAYASTLMQTGTAARATSADYATVAGTATNATYATSAGTAGVATNATILLGESAWITMSGTTGLLYRVADNTNVIRVVSHSQDYNGPMGPFTWDGSDWTGDDGKVEVFPTEYQLNSTELGWVSENSATATGVFTACIGLGTVTLDWGLATNAYAIATTADLDAALAAYSTNGHGHAIADVDGLQDALDTIPAEAEIESIAESAASAALATIPSAGCTDLSTSTNVTVTGATVTYAAAPSGPYTIGIATNAPRYAYAIEIAGTNAASFAAGITLRGDWTPSGTNLVVLYPGTGTLYRAAGRAY